jgi:DNA topoisomerase-1
MQGEQVEKVKSGNGNGHEPAAPAVLHYVSDLQPGIRRLKRGGGFTYVDVEGRRITNAAERKRIAALVIPPAWIDVWISPDAFGHILATGRDSRGRKQYIYHPLWHELRSQDRFSALLEFGQSLPRMRSTIDRHLRQPTLSRERVLALMVRLLETTLIRVGNREYARSNDSYGLTTLRRKHVRREGNRLRFAFQGKSGKAHSITLHDPRAATVLKHCEELPGQQMFQYVDESGAARSIQSQDVNDYVRAVSGRDFTAKDLRTWGGTVVAARTLLEYLSASETPRTGDPIKAAVKAAAHALGNTAAVARRHYVHPAILAAYDKGTLARHRDAAAKSRAARYLSLEERVVIRILRAEGKARRRKLRTTVRPAPDVGQQSSPRSREPAIGASAAI